MRAAKRRLNTTTWVLIVLAGVLLVGLLEAARAFLAGAPSGSPTRSGTAAPAGFDPAFKVGDLAPDFTLPDATGKPHTLSRLVSGDTLLVFACGCANCLDLETYLGILTRRMGARAPKVVSVTTMPRESEESWVQRTGLERLLLYEEKKGPIMAEYRGHPCPRLFRLAADRKVTWMSPSPKDEGELRVIGTLMAEELGFSPDFPPSEAGPAGPGG